MKTLASLTLTPGPDAVPQAMDWLEGLARQEHWNPRTTFKVNLCLDEALTNIVMYGFTGRAGDAHAPRINLEALSDGESIVLSLVDNGMPFDPTQAAPKDLAESIDEAEIGGQGLRLMHHYLQDIQYSRTREHNQLRLTMALDPGKA